MFFQGCESSNRVTKLLNAYRFFAEIGIRNLIDKTLVTITYNRIEMYDLIQ